MEKPIAPNFSIRKRVKIPHRLNPKEPPRRIVLLRDMIRIDTPSYNATHMESAITSPMAECNASYQVTNTKNKQPFSTIRVGVLLPTNLNLRNEKLEVAKTLN